MFEIVNIFAAVISVSALAIILGAVLGYSSKKFHVETDPRVEKVLEALPGANCGGCGCPGCALFATKVVNNEANYDGCPAGGEATATAIAGHLGIDASAVSDKKVAFVKCNGICDNVKNNYVYNGLEDCIAASHLATAGSKACTYSCLGMSSCKKACPFNAIEMIDGVAVINRSKCVSCGKCVDVCPKKLIEIVPLKSTVQVLCNSKDKGKDVKAKCGVGCIACGICKKNCPEEAITVENNIAHIDSEKCTLCMTCVAKCPTKSIRLLTFESTSLNVDCV